MELEEMKKAWERLDQRLDQQLKYSQKLFLDTQLTKARKGLRPLFWGQIVQVIFGILVLLFGVASWTHHLGVIHQMIPGWIIHVYGVLTIISAGVVMSLIGKIDYSAPVASIQSQLDRLRSVHIKTSLLLGLAWWLLWIPFFVALLGFVGADITMKARASSSFRWRSASRGSWEVCYSFNGRAIQGVRDSPRNWKIRPRAAASPTPRGSWMRL